MDIADILIWGGFGFLLVRFLLPHILELLGLTVEKRPKDKD